LRLCPSVFRTRTANNREAETALEAAIAASAFRQVIDGSFYTNAGKQSSRILGFDTDLMYFFLSEFLNHVSNVLWLTSRRNAVFFALYSKEYIRQAIRLMSIGYIAY